jgi:hypothetical protein
MQVKLAWIVKTRQSLVLTLIFASPSLLPFFCDLSHFCRFSGKTIDKKEFVVVKRAEKDGFWERISF